MFLILVLFTYNAHGQQIYDLSNISEEKIVFYSKLIVGHENELKDMLLLAIELSLENIVNSNTTRTPIPHIPYKYQYLVVFPDFTFTVMQKEKYKLVYNPSHPDAIRGGELTGYLKFPDIGIDQECLDIAEIIKTLRLIEIECKE
jgi:hypothetical protein